MKSALLRTLSSPGSYPVRALLAIAVPLALLLGLASPLFGLGEESVFIHLADQRTFLNIPCFFDVISNLGFLVVGLGGLLWTLKQARSNSAAWGRGRLTCLIGLFGSVLLTAFGSTWFHLAPGHETLFWDRLPMALGFSALVSLLIADRISPVTGAWTLPVLSLTGLGTVFIWQFQNKVQPYSAFQGGSLLAVLLCLLLFPKGRLPNRPVFVALGGYALAKVFELADLPIFNLTHVISGHTIKHLVAALALAALWRGLSSVSNDGGTR